MVKPSDFMDTRTSSERVLFKKQERKQLINTKINTHANDFWDEKRIKIINSSLNCGLIKEKFVEKHVAGNVAMNFFFFPMIVSQEVTIFVFEGFTTRPKKSNFKKRQLKSH